MGRASTLGLGLVSLGVLALVSGLGCQPNNPNSGGGSGGGGSNGGTTNSTGGMNTGGMNTGGMNTGGGMTGGGGTGGVTDACTGDAVEATVYQITHAGVPGAVGAKIKVKVDGLIATSRKFLVSKSSSTNSCLWGVFASAPKDEAGNQLLQAVEYSGILVLSYGNDATQADPQSPFFCPKLSDAADIGDVIPNDVKPGDVLNVYGTSDKFLLKNCSNPGDSEVGQFQISAACKMERTGTAALPSPAVVDAVDFPSVGSPTADVFHDKWGGAQLTVENVAVTSVTVNCPDGMSECVVNKFGQMVFDEGFGTGDKIYYRGYSQNFCHAGPMFDAGTTFTRVTGLHYLDFCTWNLQPRDKCADYDPASNDCAGATMCMFDQ